LPLAQDALHLIDVLIADALAAPIASLQAAEHMLPHLLGWLQPLGPLSPALQFPLEEPLPGELLGTQEALLSRCGVFIRPAYLDRHCRPPSPVNPAGARASGPGTLPGPPARASSSSSSRTSGDVQSPTRWHAGRGAALRYGRG